MVAMMFALISIPLSGSPQSDGVQTQWEEVITLEGRDYALPRLSPDGRMLAYVELTIDSTLTTPVSVLRLKDRSRVQVLSSRWLASYGPYGAEVRDIRWGGTDSLRVTVTDGNYHLTFRLALDGASEPILVDAEDGETITRTEQRYLTGIRNYLGDRRNDWGSFELVFWGNYYAPLHNGNTLVGFPVDAGAPNRPQKFVEITESGEVVEELQASQDTEVFVQFHAILGAHTVILAAKDNAPAILSYRGGRFSIHTLHSATTWEGSSGVLRDLGGGSAVWIQTNGWGFDTRGGFLARVTSDGTTVLYESEGLAGGDCSRSGDLYAIAEWTDQNQRRIVVARRVKP